MKPLLKMSVLIIIILLSMQGLDAQNVGSAAPDFTFKNMQGIDVKLSDHKGKVVFLYLFGYGCPFCLSSGNTTQTKVEAVYGHRSDFQALGLDLWNGSLVQVQAFQSNTMVMFPLLLSASSMSGKYSTTYDRILVVDQQGVLRYKGSTPVSSGLSAAISIIDQLLLVASSDDLEGSAAEGLNSVFPNPAIDHASIRFSIYKETLVNVRLLNTLGQEVRKFSPEVYGAGTHTRQVSTTGLPAGLYFVRVDLPGKSFIRKLLVNR